MFRALLLAFSIITMTACNLIQEEQRIDGSSAESAKASIQRIKTTLSDDDVVRFEQAARAITADAMGGALLRAMSGASEEELASGFLKSLDGRTAQEVIAQGDAILAERRDREQQQARQEVAELEAKKKNAAKGRDQLQAFEVTRSRFFKRERRFGGAEPIIELSVRNGTGHAVSRAYFNGVLATPGRSVPWLEETFNYSISGGLEPGETAKWSLSPNMFGKWGNVSVAPDMVFTVTVRQLDGPGGETLFKADWSERDQKRLTMLREKIESHDTRAGV